MSEFQKIRLGDFFQIKHGYAFKSEFFGNEGDFIVLTPGNFEENGGFKPRGEKEKFYTAVPPEDYVLSKGDLLVAMTDLTQEARILGSSMSVPVSNRYLHNQRLGKVVDLLEDKLRARYLYYLFNWGVVREQLKATATGATVKHTAPDRIYSVEVPLPPVKTQDLVVSILSAYDDLITNNVRRVALLEEMVRRMFEEWFIKFRYPGHGDDGFIEAAIGLVPSGWKVVPLVDAVDVNPRTIVSREGEKLYLPMSALSTSGMTIGDMGYRSGNSGSKFQNGDTLMARITPSLENGKTGFVSCLPPSQPTAAGSTEFIVLRSKTVTPEWVYCLARTDRVREVAIKSMSGASGRQRVRIEAMKELLVVQPPTHLLSIFDEFAKPIFRLTRSLSESSRNLALQRDLLLPKLVSGRLGREVANKSAEVVSS